MFDLIATDEDGDETDTEWTIIDQDFSAGTMPLFLEVDKLLILLNMSQRRL